MTLSLRAKMSQLAMIQTQTKPLATQLGRALTMAARSALLDRILWLEQTAAKPAPVASTIMTQIPRLTVLNAAQVISVMSARPRVQNVHLGKQIPIPTHQLCARRAMQENTAPLETRDALCVWVAQ